MYPLSYLLGFKRFQDGAWFEPSTPKQISDAVKLLALSPDDNVAELGAGNGSTVLALAQAGAQVVGFEKDERLFKQVQFPHNVKMIQSDFWQEDLSRFNKIYIYQFKTVMPRLEQKLLHELPKVALVASNTWVFPHWKISQTQGDIHLYRKDI